MKQPATETKRWLLRGAVALLATAMVASLFRQSPAAEAVHAGDAAQPSSAWGNLQGQIIYDCEDLLKAKAIAVNKDEAICDKNMQTESLMVNPRDGGWANVFVYLRLNPKQHLPAVHADYAATAQAEVTLEIWKCHFTPHVIAMRTTQSLSIMNRDETNHAPEVHPFNNGDVCALVPATPNQIHRLPQAESIPFSVTCNVHPWMKAWVLVRDDPYMAISDEHGRFEIKNLPVGKWTFQLWHEKEGFIQHGKRDGQVELWPKGRMNVTIAPGKNDLGELHITQ